MIDDQQAAYPSHEAYMKCLEDRIRREQDDFDAKTVVIRRGDKRYTLLRWIPVSDHLPEIGRWVSVWLKMAKLPCSARRYPGGWTLENGDYVYEQEGRVTHWAPLLEPPAPVTEQT